MIKGPDKPILTRRSVMGGLVSFPALPALSTAPAFAQGAFPERPIRMICPFGPGTGTDAFARQVTGNMQAFLGQPIVVENRAGANAITGTEAAVRSAPDGYTLLFSNDAMTCLGPSTVQAALRRDEGYRSGRGPCPVRIHAGGFTRFGRENRAGACCARQGEARHAQRRRHRRRHRLLFHRRSLREGCRCEDHRRAIPAGRRAAVRGHADRPRLDDLLSVSVREDLHRSRPADPTGRHQPRT